MDDQLRILKNGPVPSDIEKILNEYLENEHTLQQQLQFINTLLQEIVIIYQSLKSPVRHLLQRVFYCTIGLSNLLNHYKLTKNDIYLKFTKNLLVDPSLLSSTLDACNNKRDEVSQVKALFVGSKIFQTFGGALELKKYLELVVKQLIETARIGKHDIFSFINPYLSIHPIEAKFVFFDNFLTDNNFEISTGIYSKMNQVHQKTFILRSLIPYLSTKISIDNRDTVTRIISHYSFAEFESYIIRNVGELENIELQQAISSLVQHPKKQLVELLEIWGNEQYIKNTRFEHQEYLTKELLILLNYISADDRSQISREKSFLDAITSRISSNDNNNRNLGLIVAKKVTNGDIKFDIVDEIIIEPYNKPNLNTKIDFTDLLIGESMQKLSLSSKKVSSVEDSDDESELEDDGEDEQNGIETLFLKDLIKKLNDEKTTNLAPLLSHTVKLVRQKATFKLELEFYSEELSSIIVGLLNKFDEPNFEQLKINALVSIIVTNTKTITHIMSLLFTGDYSIQQRMIILSSISLSARELRGLDDEFIEKIESDFPTRKIEQRHTNPVVQEIEDKPPRFEEIKDDENQFIGQGKIQRVSKKLSKPAEKTKPNNFSRIATKFFYPLANGWIKGIDVGTYNEMFLKHYLQTLELIIKAAYPCHEFDDMYELYNAILENASNVTI